MFRPQTLVFLLLVALAALGNADPHGSSNKVCSNIRKCDRAVTPYCSSVLKIPIRTRTTTICKTSTVKQSPKPTTTVTVTITEVPTVSTCLQPAIPTPPAKRNTRYAPPQYKPNCLRSLNGKSLTSACKCISIRTSTTTVRTTKYVKTVTQTAEPTEKAGMHSTVTTTATGATPVFAVPTGPLNLFAIGTGNDADTGQPFVNGPNQYLQARQSNEAVPTRLLVEFGALQVNSPRIRFDGTTLVGVNAPITGLVAGLSQSLEDQNSVGTELVIFDAADSNDRVAATCRITSASDGTCPVVCRTAFRPFDSFLQAWSFANFEEDVNEPLDTFAVSPLA